MCCWQNDQIFKKFSDKVKIIQRVALTTQKLGAETSGCNNNIEVVGEVKGKQRPGGQSEEDASIQLGR